LLETSEEIFHFTKKYGSSFQKLHQTKTIQHQDTTRVTQPNLIGICFARKSISRQRRIFCPSN